MPWLLTLAWAFLTQPPNYDALSDRYGNVVTEQHQAALIALVQGPEQLEMVHADAAGGNARAGNIWGELELNMARAGWGVADRATRPGCLVPGYRELSRTCIPDWSFVDFLAKDKPGGSRLREVLFRAFAIRARERGLQNQVILSAVNGLVGVGVAAAVLREVEVAASAEVSSGPKIGSSGGPGAGKRFAPGTKDAAEAQAEGKCVFCGRETTRSPGPSQRNTDHAQPKSTGGNNTLDNAQNTCRTCNLEKGTKTTNEHLGGGE